MDVVRGQIDAVAEDLRLDATKIGALGSAAVVEAVAAAVRAHRTRLGRIVLDPVMVSAHGTPLISAEGASALGRLLLPLVDVLTPNMAEAAQLLGQPLATSIEEIREQALALQGKGPGSVLITGGRLPGEDVVDVLVHDGGTDLLRARREPDRRVRGPVRPCRPRSRRSSPVSPASTGRVSWERSARTGPTTTWSPSSPAPASSSPAPPRTPRTGRSRAAAAATAR